MHVNGDVLTKPSKQLLSSCQTNKGKLPINYCGNFFIDSDFNVVISVICHIV